MNVRHVAIIAGHVALAAYAASGLTMIQPDEVGVVRRLGAIAAEPWQPGLHWGLPWGIDRVDRLKLTQTRTLQVGAAGQGAAPLSRSYDTSADDSLTGDLNLVAAEVIVQFRIRDPVAYLLRARDIEGSLRAVSEWSTARALARRGIDELLTTGRAEVADDLVRAIQAQADESGLGITVVAVRLGRVAPPTAVAPAFADAARARSDRRQAVTRAEEYRDRSSSEARALAREIADAAAGRADLLVRPARGEADRFTRVLAEARKSPAAYRQRLYLEALAELLPRFRRKVLVAPGLGLDIGLTEDAMAPRETAPPVGAGESSGGPR